MKLKWLIPVGVLIMSFLILNGCQLPFIGNETTTDQVNYEFVTYDGLLQSLGSVKFNPDATHLLRLDDGTVLYVYSNFHNLWDTEYLNQHVEVSGLLIPGEEAGDKSVLAIEQLTVLEEEESSEKEEITMKTYVNEKLGFAIDYQTDWELEERTQAVSFYAPQPAEAEEFMETDMIQVSTMLNTEGLSIEEWVLAYQDVASDYVQSVVSVDQIPAIKVQNEDSIIYYVEGDGRVYLVMILSHQEDLQLEHDMLFKEMLLSFDLLSDGQRISVDKDEDLNENSNTETFDSVLNNESSDENHSVTINSLEAFLAGYTPLTYDFVDPDYIYVTYLDDETLRRVLLQDIGNGKFETLAEFKEGAITDWELVSGEDVAKGRSQTSVDASTGSSMVILEGFRALESAAMNFEMQYPASWYYSRSGSFFYFSNVPADANNAQVTLELRDEYVSTLKTWSSAGLYFADIPRDDDSSYRLSGSSEFTDTIKIMAESLKTTS